MLVCPKREGQKYEKALEWGIPVVGMEWIEQVAGSVESKPRERSEVEGKTDVDEVQESPKAVSGEEVAVEGQEYTQDHGQETFIPVQPSSLYSPDKSKSSIWNQNQAETASGSKGSGRLDTVNSKGNRKAAASAPAKAKSKSKLPTQVRGEPTMPCLDTDIIPSSRTPSPMWSNPKDSSHKPVALDPTLPSLSNPPSSSVSSGIQLLSSSKAHSSSSSVSSKNQSEPASALAERRASLSPVKVDLARTRALHDSIASLLGKRERLNSEMDIGSGDVNGDNAEESQEGGGDETGSMRQTRGRAAKASGAGNGKPAAKPKPRPKPKPKASAKAKSSEQEEQALAEPEAPPTTKPKPKPRPRARGKAAAAKESLHTDTNQERTVDSPPPTKRSRPLRGKTNDISSSTLTLPMEIQVDSQTLDEMNMDDSPEGQSLRVTYEDPSQRDERKRLLDLLGS